MEYINNFEAWRAEEIAKVFLYKSGIDLIINKYPTPLFDFYVQLKYQVKVKFAIEVKIKSRFQSSINRQIQLLKSYRDTNIIDLPVIILRIDEKKETGEIDFLVLPSLAKNKLLIKYEFEFEPLTNQSFKTKVNSIIKWYNQ